MNTTNSIARRFQKLPGFLSALVFAGVLTLGSCDKKKDTTTPPPDAVSVTQEPTTTGTTGASKDGSTQVLTSVVTVAAIRPSQDGHSAKVLFNENAQLIMASDPAVINAVKEALRTNTPLQITFNPWEGALITAVPASAEAANSVRARTVTAHAGIPMKIDFTRMPDAVLNEPSAAMGVLNATDPGLNNVIPDFATAQLMFDYIAHQCCELPGPYSIDYCIPFQYCIDGCYARAHKMCWIINNRYKYGTKKVFSFANDAAGIDELSVQGQKWGGCCINWWYHVAPLVTVQTTTGPKAYVFDPAMFNQPVLLATWLHAQENPACLSTPHVTMINIQPNSSYWPAGYSGYSFNPDPTYSLTNAKLVEYSSYITCP